MRFWPKKKRVCPNCGRKLAADLVGPYSCADCTPESDLGDTPTASNSAAYCVIQLGSSVEIVTI